MARRWPWLTVLVLACLVVVAGCGADDVLDAPETPAAQPDADPAPTADQQPEDVAETGTEPEADEPDDLAFDDLSSEEQQGTDSLCRAAHGEGDPMFTINMVRAGELRVPEPLVELADRAAEDQDAGFAAIREACDDMEWRP